MKKRYLKASKESTDTSLEKFYELTELTGVVIGKASSSLGRAGDTNMRNIKCIVRFRGNPGIITVRPTTLHLEAAKRAPESTIALSSGEAELSRHGPAMQCRGNK